MTASVVIAIVSAAIGQTTSVVHSGVSFTTDLQFPGRLAPDGAGGAYVTDPPTDRVLHYDAAGSLVEPPFVIPEGAIGIAVSLPNIFVSRRDGEVGVYDVAFVEQPSSPLAQPPIPMLPLLDPNDLAIDTVAGEVYVADSGSNQILVYDAVTLAFRTGWGVRGTGAGQFESPQALALNVSDFNPANHRVYVADADGYRVQAFDKNGMPKDSFGYRTLFVGDPSAQVAWFARSAGVAVDDCGLVYLSDALMGTVRVFDGAGNAFDRDPDPLVDNRHDPVINYGTAPGEVRLPCDIMIDDGKLFVASTGNSAVEVYDVVCTPPGLRSSGSSTDVAARPVSRKKAAKPIRLTDTPFAIAEAAIAGEYSSSFDLNRDRTVDVDDVALAAELFGAGTVELFMTGESADPSAFRASSVEGPHLNDDLSNACWRCHAMNGLPNGDVAAEGQENLCLSCHSSANLAMHEPIARSGKGNSHPWAIPADQGDVAGPGPETLLSWHLDDEGDVRCGTCHDPHTSAGGDPYLRAESGGGLLCMECHRGSTAPTNHAVGMAHGPEYCTDCHDMHATGDRHALTKEMMYSWYINGFAGGMVSTGLTDHTIGVGDGGFVDPDADEYGLCDVCHQYYDDSVAPPVVSASFLGLSVPHDESMPACTQCHLHHRGFLPGLDVDPAGGYVGSDSCGICHTEKFATFMNSGHPYKLNEVVGGATPTYPFSSIAGALGLMADDDDGAGDGIPTPTDNSLGTPLSYSDVSFVIGGYGWKSRWIDLDGYIVTGSEVQYNLETLGMVAYHNDEVDKPYNCGNCHTTGWKRYTSEIGDSRNLNRQNNLPGMDGTFAAAGVQCEACHGSGSAHAASPSHDNITHLARARTTDDFLASDMAYGKAVACGDCHTRDGEKDYPLYVGGPGLIAAKGGLIKHHEQYDEMLGINPDDDPAFTPAGPHASVLCIACHDPHTSTKYMAVSGDPPGMNKDCTVCHNATGIGGKDYSLAGGLFDGMTALDCIDCHMPKLAKSAVAHAAVGTGPVTGDIRTHIFKIGDLSQALPQFTGSGSFAYPWITQDWACKTCHNSIDEFDLTFPAVMSIHGGPPAGPDARRGGLLYDKWWKVNGAAEPAGDHPLYATGAGTKSGSTTFRCKECHGWDYIGKDGRYESGSHYTGFIGVLGAVTTMTEAEIFDVIKNDPGTTTNGHDFAAYGLSDGDINDLVAFIKTGGVINTSPFINTTGSPGSYSYSFNGNAATGETLYDGDVNPAADCTMCHAHDGTAIDFGGGKYVGTVANSNPQETLHKIRFGHPGSRMTSYLLLGMTDAQAADVGAHAETLP